MIQNDEAPSSQPASVSGAANCVKCGTSYPSEVEFIQHLLLHIERTYLRVTLDRDEVDKFKGVSHIKDKMSSDGETELNQAEEVETKPKLNNNFESHADSNNLSSAKDDDRRGSVSGDDDSMSICSSTGAPTSAAREAPKMVVKAEVHAPDSEPTPAEANGRRSSESSLGKDQSGAEDDDDGKNSEGSKSPAKPTTPSLPFAITLRKSEDLMAQTNYSLIQKRLQELYDRCQGKKLQENLPAGSNYGTASATTVSGSVSRNQASSIQNAAAAAHPPSTTNESQDDWYDATPKLSECGSENSDDNPLTPTINAEIDAVLKGIDFSCLPDQIDGGADSDGDMGLQISPADCDWIDDNDKGPNNPEFSESAFKDEPSPPPASKPKKVGPKPKIYDYFAVTRKSGSNLNSVTDGTQVPKTQPRFVPEKSSKEKDKLVYCSENEDDGSNVGCSTAKSCGEIVKVSNPETTSKNVTPSKRYTSFKGVLVDENQRCDDFDERGFDQSTDKSVPVSNVERVPMGSRRKFAPFPKNVSADGFKDNRTGVTAISTKPRTDSLAVEGSSWERNVPQNVQMGKMPNKKRFEDLKPVMTERCGSDRETSVTFAGYRPLKPILTDTVLTAESRNAPGRIGRHRAHVDVTGANNDVLNAPQNRPQLSNAPNSRGDRYSDQDSHSDHADTSSQPLQACGTDVDARYAQVMRNLGHGISVSVTPSGNKQRASSLDVGKQVPTNEGKTSADRGPMDRFGHDENPVEKARSNKGEIGSGRKGQTRSHFPAAEARDDSNLKESTSNPAGGDGLFRADSASDLDTPNSGHWISDSMAPSGNKQRKFTQKMGKQLSTNQGETSADGSRTSRFGHDEKTIGKARSNKGGTDSERKFPTQFSAAETRCDPNLKESTSNLGGGDGQFRAATANVNARYDLDVPNLGLGISVSMTPSGKKQRSCSQEMEKQVPTNRSETSTDNNPTSKFGHDKKTVGRARSNEGGRKVSTRPQSSMSVDARGDPNLKKQSTCDPTDGDSVSMGARYDVDVRDLSQGSNKGGRRVSTRSHSAMTADTRGDTSLKKQSTISHAGDGDSASMDARYDLFMRDLSQESNKGGRKVPTRPHSSMTADARGDPNLKKQSTCDPADGDSASMDARYDVDVRDLSQGSNKGGRKVSTRPCSSMTADARGDTNLTKRSTISHAGDGDSASMDARYDVDVRNLGHGSNKGERNVSTRPHSSMTADARGDTNLKKQSTSHLTDGDSASMDARYDLNMRNLGRGISQRLSQSVDNQPGEGTNQSLIATQIKNLGANLGRDQIHKSENDFGIALKHPQTAASLTDEVNPDKESVVNPIDMGGNQPHFDIAAAMSAYDKGARNLGKEISMSLDPALNNQRLTDKEIDDLIASALQGRSGMVISKAVPNQRSRSFSNSTNGNLTTNLDSVQFERTEGQQVSGKRHSRQQNNPKISNQSSEVRKKQNSERAMKTAKKKVPRRQQPVPHYEDENSLFEGQTVPDSSSEEGPVKSNHPPLGPNGSEETKDSDSSMPDIKIPDLPPFFEAFPTAPAAVVGKKYSEAPNQDGGTLPAERQEVKTAVKPIPGPSVGTPKAAPSMKHQLPQLAPTPSAAQRFALPSQRPNKVNLKKKSQAIFADTDSSGSFEVKRKPKSVDQNSDKSSRIQAAKVKVGNKMPVDFGGLFTGLSPPKPLIPVSVTSAGASTPGKSYTDLQPLESSFYQDPPVNSENPSHPFPSQEEFANGDFQSSQKDLYRCALCPRSFVTAAELDTHAATEGHIICSMSEACASLSFDTQSALSHHQAMVHQAPAQTTAVQRLAAQVERLPQTFGGYPPQVPPQPYGTPSPYSLPQTSYNGPKLGSQVVLTPMSASVAAPPPQPPPNLPNLPGIQVTKRPAPPPVDSSPSKMNRSDDGMPSIRLPDSITLVKSQPAPPPQNAVADMLATRGITMVASGSRAGPTQATSIQPVAPPKRLPNVPSAISIVPSRAQPVNRARSVSQSQQAQRFAVPPAPQQRGRHVTNLGTVDLTRDEQNGRMRGPGRPLGLPNSPRRFSCTICDKVYPTGESLQAHMAVHGSNKPGRYMCEICRVVYTNEAKLQHHKKTVHAVRAASDTEMVIPICDINQPGVKEKLLQCGIRHVVQVQSVRNANDTAAFGLPIIPIDLARNEAYSRLDDLGASNILSLGSLRNIYR